MSYNLGIDFLIKRDKELIALAKKRLAYNENPNDDKRKSRRIADWKRSGVKAPLDDWEGLYEHYINTNTCDDCNIDLVRGNFTCNKKCLDHCHTTGEFRGVVCMRCNFLRGK